MKTPTDDRTYVPLVPTSFASCRLIPVALLVLSLTGVGVVAPSAAGAAETYSAALQTAVQDLVVGAESNAGYDRDAQFGDWIDADGDCQNTRHEVLVIESEVAPTLSSSGCTVTAGQWTTFYDDQTYTLASDVDIDHMVPVAEAWGSGAQAWSQERRVAFYNDLDYAFALNAIDDGLNQSKSARGPEEWLPPANTCQYVVAWTAMKIRWGLSADTAERDALAREAGGCPDSTVTVTLADGTADPGDGGTPPADGGSEPAPAPVPDEPGTKRLSGNDRYSTAAAIVQDSFPAGPVPVVFIATGEAFADALAGGPAADALGGPVLPVAKAGIPAPILSELDRLDPARIVILGGPGAVSDAIAAQLQSYTTGTVTRAAGVNRYDTAAKVAQEFFTAPAPQVLIATGLGYADALAGGAVGALTDSPVLLVAPNSLPPETAAALRALQPGDIAVLGGPNAVSDAVLEQLGSFTAGGVNRLSGTSRYETAARVAQIFWPATTDVVYLASGLNFPDALAGVPAAGRDGAPLLLVDPQCMPAATRAELDRLQPSTIVVLGGPGAVSDAAASGTSCAAPPPPPPPAEEPPPNPGDNRNCTDFATQREAQEYFDFYYQHYGDVSRLDSDNDLIACEGRP